MSEAAALGNGAHSSGCCEPESSETGGEVARTAGCPMESMCKNFTESKGGRYGLFLIGGLFVVLGVSILIQPILMVWLAGLTSILLGLLVFAGGFAVRRFGARLECCDAQ